MLLLVVRTQNGILRDFVFRLQFPVLLPLLALLSRGRLVVLVALTTFCLSRPVSLSLALTLGANPAILLLLLLVFPAFSLVSPVPSVIAVVIPRSLSLTTAGRVITAVVPRTLTIPVPRPVTVSVP